MSERIKKLVLVSIHASRSLKRREKGIFYLSKYNKVVEIIECMNRPCGILFHIFLSAAKDITSTFLQCFC